MATRDRRGGKVGDTPATKAYAAFTSAVPSTCPTLSKTLLHTLLAKRNRYSWLFDLYQHATVYPLDSFTRDTHPIQL